MSDPYLVQFTFTIKENMPKDMKKLLLYLFTDYYEKYYPEKNPDYSKEICPLLEKYEPIMDFWSSDCYHNIDLQHCQLESNEVYDLDTRDTWDKDSIYAKDRSLRPINLGISIITLPRSKEYIDNFLKLVGPYIGSHTPTIGIATWDCDDVCYYYYFDFSTSAIKCHEIKTDSCDELIVERNEL